MAQQVEEKKKRKPRSKTSLAALLLQSISKYRVIHIAQKDVEKRAQYMKRIAALEAEAVYPLGADDTFQIDHGADYFAFFDRLGETHYYAVVRGRGNKERVVAVGAAVLRHIPLQQQEDESAAVWYLCDLKVHPEYRGSHLPMLLFNRALPLAYKRCTRAYAISMNGAPGTTNRVVRMFDRFSWLVPIKLSAQLAIFSVNADDMKICHKLLEKHRRATVSYVSLKGVKDLVLGSSGAPMPLLHVQYHQSATATKSESKTVPLQRYDTPQAGHTHMFCMLLNDALVSVLHDQLKLKPTATASVISHKMTETDWNFIMTSDI